ncbi:MAG: amidohydrolase family protein [Puniceicoccaceae bacterium]
MKPNSRPQPKIGQIENWYRGAMIIPVDDETALYYNDGIIGADGTGAICDLGEAGLLLQRYNLESGMIKRNEGLLMPAFFDAHFHWVQDRVRQMPKDSLLEWLEQYTFPTEARFEEEGFAREEARRFWSAIYSFGTIGGFCYSSIHPGALDTAMNEAPEAFSIGNVLMTMNCPEALRLSPEDAVRGVAEGIERYGRRYLVTPRFAPVTDPEVMQAAAKLGSAAGTSFQTHLSETPAEIEWVLGIYRQMEGFEKVADYSSIYDAVGLLGPKTVLGHCLHLSEREWALLGERGAMVASCPTSNAPLAENGLGSGLFPFETADRFGVDWALGSDIGGGPSLSMFDVLESFVRQNRAAGVAGGTYCRGLYRATVAGARICGWGEKKGRLAVGFDFDAVRIGWPEEYGPGSEPEQILEGVLSRSSRADYEAMVEETIVGGKSVFRRTGHA